MVSSLPSQPILSIPYFTLFKNSIVSVYVANTMILAEGNKNHIQFHNSEPNTVNVLVYNQQAFCLYINTCIYSYKLG